MISLSVDKRGSRLKAERLNVIEPRNTKNRKADAVDSAESKIAIDVKVRKSQLPRGRRTQHATHSYESATRETLTALQTEVWSTYNKR